MKRIERKKRGVPEPESNQDRPTLFSNWTLKDYIQSFGVIAAVLISLVSLWQSKQSIDITRSEKLIRLNVTARELVDNPVRFFPFPQGDESPFPGTFGFLSVDVQLQIDNLSERRVSVTAIHATPIFEDPYDGEMTPFWTNGIVITTDFNAPFRTPTDTGEITTLLPFALEPGDSIVLIGTIGWPVDSTAADVLSQAFSAGDQEFSLYDIEKILAKNGLSLWRNEVDVSLDESGEIVQSVSFSGKSKLIYEIDVNTSFDTLHSAYLESPAMLFRP